MTYRVVHCGTGNVGRFALESVINNPELELVGHYVSDPAKAGKDAGEMIGLAPVGIKATNNWDELVALKADCLNYFGNSTGREDEAIADLVPFLEAGTNVVTFSGFALAHPATTPPAQRKLIDDACAKGQSTCFFTGIDPGWATTDLAIAALAAADRVDCVRVLELGWFGHYQSQSLRDVFGFGIEPGVTPGMLRDGKLMALWAPTLYHIAEVLGVEIDDWETMFEVDVLDHDVEAGIGTIKAGTAVVLHFELRAMSGGKPIAIVEHVDKVHRDVGKDWKAPHAPVDLVYRIEIEGSPSFSVEFAPDNGSMGACCAMPVVNAIPALCQAPAGLLGPLDLPRYWTRNVRADARRA